MSWDVARLGEIRNTYSGLENKLFGDKAGYGTPMFRLTLENVL